MTKPKEYLGQNQKDIWTNVPVVGVFDMVLTLERLLRLLLTLDMDLTPR